MPGLNLSDLSAIITPATNPTQVANSFNQGMDTINRALEAEARDRTERAQLEAQGKQHGERLAFERDKLASDEAHNKLIAEAARRKEVNEGVDKMFTMLLDPAQHDHAMALARSLGLEAAPYHDPAKQPAAAPAAPAPAPEEELPPAPPPSVADIVGAPDKPPNLGVTAGVPRIPAVPGAGAPPAMKQEPGGGVVGLGGLMGDILANPSGAAGRGPSSPAAPAAPAGPIPGPEVPDEQASWVIYDPLQGNKPIAHFDPLAMRGQAREAAMKFAREIGRGQLNPRFKELADLMAPSIIPALEAQGYDRKTTMEMYKDMVEAAFQREQSAESVEKSATMAGARNAKAADDANERIAARAWDQVRQTGKDLNVEEHLKSVSALAQATSMMKSIDPHGLVDGNPDQAANAERAGAVLANVKRFLVRASGDNRISDADLKSSTGQDTESWLEKIQGWLDRGAYGKVGSADYNNMMAAVEQLSLGASKMGLSDYKALSSVVSQYGPGGRLANERAYDTVEPYLSAIFTPYQQQQWFAEAQAKYGPQAQAASRRNAPSPAASMTPAQRQALLDHADSLLGGGPPAP